MMPAERSPRRAQPELSRRDLLRGAAGLAIGAATAGLWLPESASARAVSTPASPTRRTENAPQQIDEALRPNLTLQGTDFRREDGTQLQIRLVDNTDQGVQHFKESIATLRQPSIPTQEVRSQLAKSESGRATLRLHSLAADTNRNVLTRAEAGDGSFALNGHMVDDRFGTYWIGNGGLRQQGLPISDGFNENNPTNGQTYRTQYFERARFEYHPEKDPEYQVLLGLTGREQYYAKYPNGASNQIPNTAPGAAQFPDTGKYVGDRFLTYWAANGGLRQQGLPISDEFDEVNPTDGKSYRVQYFERARFEYHPEVSDPTYQILLGLTGREQFLAKYPNGAPELNTGPEPHFPRSYRTPSRKTGEAYWNGKSVNPGGWVDEVVLGRALSYDMDTDFKGRLGVAARIIAVNKNNSSIVVDIGKGDRLTVSVPDQPNDNNPTHRLEIAYQKSGMTVADTRKYGANISDLEGQDLQKNVKGDVIIVIPQNNADAEKRSGNIDSFGYIIYQ